MVLALLALGACVAAMVAVSMWDRRTTVRPATAPPRMTRQSDA
jgi:Flp pilus assembly protein CpaB